MWAHSLTSSVNDTEPFFLKQDRLEQKGLILNDVCGYAAHKECIPSNRVLIWKGLPESFVSLILDRVIIIWIMKPVGDSMHKRDGQLWVCILLYQPVFEFWEKRLGSFFSRVLWARKDMDQMFIFCITPRTGTTIPLLTTDHNQACGRIFTDPFRNKFLDREGGLLASYGKASPVYHLLELERLLRNTSATIQITLQSHWRGRRCKTEFFLGQ